MKKIVPIFLFACLFSISGFAKTHSKSKDRAISHGNLLAINRFSLSQLDIGRVYTFVDKKSLNKFVATFSVSLSCVSITYSGETAEAGIQITLAGYGGILTDYLEWYWCQGGKNEVDPYIPDAYA